MVAKRQVRVDAVCALLMRARVGVLQVGNRLGRCVGRNRLAAIPPKAMGAVLGASGAAPQEEPRGAISQASLAERRTGTAGPVAGPAAGPAAVPAVAVAEAYGDATEADTFAHTPVLLEAVAAVHLLSQCEGTLVALIQQLEAATQQPLPLMGTAAATVPVLSEAAEEAIEIALEMDVHRRAAEAAEALVAERPVYGGLRGGSPGRSPTRDALLTAGEPPPSWLQAPHNVRVRSDSSPREVLAAMLSSFDETVDLTFAEINRWREERAGLRATALGLPTGSVAAGTPALTARTGRLGTSSHTSSHRGAEFGLAREREREATTAAAATREGGGDGGGGGGGPIRRRVGQPGGSASARAAAPTLRQESSSSVSIERPSTATARSSIPRPPTTARPSTSTPRSSNGGPKGIKGYDAR